MKKEILSVLLVFSIVLLSGCMKPPFTPNNNQPPAGTQGIVISDFGPDVEHPTSGETIIIQARLKNEGVEEATGISGELYLIPWQSSLVQTCHNLRPPKPEIGREGEECILKWQVTLPKVERTQVYDLGAHIKYNYKTKTTATVYALSEEEYRRRMEAREPIPTVNDVVNSNAPIHVEVRMQNVMKVGDSNVPVTLIFHNVGNGNTIFQSPYFVIEKAVAKINGNVVGECGPIHLLKGGKEGSCTIHITAPSTGKEIKLPIEIETTYTYVSNVVRQMTVYPKPFD